jgi:aspartyl-tRNA(Asn)/glutamyl-tRNA(Gln) amidotransferase subunit A
VVAAGAVPVSLGSDTGGSIRQPAALCGVVGVKPTYGRVSRYGLVAYGSSLDQIGPFASTVRDAALVLQCIAGVDSRDATSSDEAPIEIPAPALDLSDVRIGVPRALLADGVDADVSAAVERALVRCEALGATLVDIELPHARYAVPTYYLVATAEASANLARFDGVRYGHRADVPRHAGLTAMYEATRSSGFGAEVQRRILLGTYVLSAGYYDAYYRKAQQVRTLITRDFLAALAQVEVVAMPTSPTTAFRLGERLEDPVQMYLADVFTVSANLSGLPGVSLPCGLDSQGLPIGLQLMGRAFDESGMLRVAAAYEDARGAFPRPAARPGVDSDVAPASGGRNGAGGGAHDQPQE